MAVGRDYCAQLVWRAITGFVRALGERAVAPCHREGVMGPREVTERKFMWLSVCAAIRKRFPIAWGSSLRMHVQEGSWKRVMSVGLLRATWSCALKAG